VVKTTRRLQSANKFCEKNAIFFLLLRTVPRHCTWNSLCKFARLAVIFCTLCKTRWKVQTRWKDPVLKLFSKRSTPWETHLWELGQYVLHRRLRTVSVVFLAHVAGATMGKQADVGRETEGTQAKLGSRSLGKIQTSTAFVSRESPCTMRRSEHFRNKRIQCTGSIRKQPAWHVYKILSADPASKFLPSGTLWSGMNCLSDVFWSLEDSQLLHSWY